jgi:diguanylate cyclase (GGDEF)-like protein
MQNTALGGPRRQGAKRLLRLFGLGASITAIAIIALAALAVYLTWSRREITIALQFWTAVAFVILLVVFAFLFVLMRSAARQVETAEAELEAMAITDPLTGLVNRRHVMEQAIDECARFARQREKGIPTAPVGFIMADIDHFKSVNDTFGHLAGDEVLRGVASRIRSATRRYDIVGRYGGEEFLAVLPHTDVDETRAVAERLWQLVREAPIDGHGVTVNVTISVGYTSACDDDVNAAIHRADEALYRAKREGRDRIAGDPAGPAAIMSDER